MSWLSHAATCLGVYGGISNFFRAGFYLPQIVPVVVAAVVWRWVLQPDWGVLNWILTSIGLEGLTRNWLGDADTALPSVMGVMVWFQLGYPLVIFMAGLQRIDPELYETAGLDGATWFQRFRHITIPLLRPDYDYGDGVTLQMYELVDGAHATAVIPSSAGDVETTFAVQREGNIITLEEVNW